MATKPAQKGGSGPNYPKSATAKGRDMATMGRLMQSRVATPAAAKKRPK